MKILRATISGLISEGTFAFVLLIVSNWPFSFLVPFVYSLFPSNNWSAWRIFFCSQPAADCKNQHPTKPNRYFPSFLWQLLSTTELQFELGLFLFGRKIGRLFVVVLIEKLISQKNSTFKQKKTKIHPFHYKIVSPISTILHVPSFSLPIHIWRFFC